ncbi:MAG: zinc/iron permease [Candidatus Peregrinibacteria bacterium GW2011_GWC2_39_14]|nr:MAG: zinc/iron permease [Candidatus Peregrinibacteria bacterium GW2011_GWC2_39_14]
MSAFLYSLISVLIVSAMSLVGVVAIFFRDKSLQNVLVYFVSFSAGALFGDVFIHLLPEAAENGFDLQVSLYVIGGILTFFVIEKFIHWRHCHVPTSVSHPHPVALMNLVGDSVHNFIDGLVIGASYMVSIPVGIATTLAVVLHEIPQEIGDFGILLYGGFSKKKAMFFNFVTALTAVLGAVVVFLVGTVNSNLTLFLVPFTAGAFIYIAGSDLIPELHKECGLKKAFFQFIFFVFGIGIMMLLLLLE